MSTTLSASNVCDGELLAARQALYRFLSIVFADPHSGNWDTLADPDVRRCVSAAAALLRDDPASRNNDLARGERSIEDLIPETVFAQLPASLEALNAEYERTFGLLVSGDCPPYGTEYIDGKFTFQRSHALADLNGFYLAFGLQPSLSHPDRADHVSMELEFLAFLIGLERLAHDSHTDDAQVRAEHIDVCRHGQQRFVQEHFAWWAPVFARLLEVKDRDSFYSAAGRLLASFIPAERAFLGVPKPTAAAAPSPIDRPDECEGCLLNVVENS